MIGPSSFKTATTSRSGPLLAYLSECLRPVVRKTQLKTPIRLEDRCGDSCGHGPTFSAFV